MFGLDLRGAKGLITYTQMNRIHRLTGCSCGVVYVLGEELSPIIDHLLDVLEAR